VLKIKNENATSLKVRKSSRNRVILLRDGNHFNPIFISVINVTSRITDAKSKASTKILAQFA
jgi:hypothetical protein